MFADIAGVVSFSYGPPSKTHLGNNVANKSTTGVRQGDHHSPILFSIGIQKCLDEVAAEFKPDVPPWAYLDDVILALPLPLRENPDWARKVNKKDRA